ncbi:MAG: phosphatase PAP2 family protein [Treponema sp.]|nr:phosphatase PAP2 family protein [Treponema sp.]
MKKKILLFFTLIASFNLFANQTEKKSKKIDLTPTNTVFKLDLQKDALILGSALTLIATDIILSNIDNNVVHIDSKLNIDEVNKIDKILMRPYSKKIDLLGTGFELATAITPLVFLSVPTTEWTTIAGMYAETMLFAYGFKELAKAVFDRPRPYMYFDDFPIEEVQKGDWNSSFFSGHTTLSFAAATFTTYVFCKYKPESKWKIPVIATSYTLAAATAAMRLLSGNHFLTDVAIGAVVGSITGLLIPFWHYVNPENPMGVIGNTDSAYLSVVPTALCFTVKL